jgi:orotate phosphoribosyltransferase
MDIEKILKDNNVLKTGHFLLTSGLHSDKYFEKFRILENPELVQMFGKMIADHFQNKNISIVCGPTTGGVIIAYEVARQMNLKCIFAESRPNEPGRVIRRGFSVPDNAKILVVDDILTTGGSIQETIEALKPFPGKVTGISVLIDRSTNLELGVEDFFACYKIPVKNYQPENCPSCKDNVPLQAPGRGGKK